MVNNDLEFIYEQLKDKYDLLLTNTFALDDGYTIDVPVLRGKSVLGRFDLYKEDEDCDEFVFTVEYAKPKKTLWCPTGEKYTHRHPQTKEQALNDVIAFMEGTMKL
jgi:hypothetical protein